MTLLLTNCSKEIYLKNGDLIFQELNCNLCNAINKTTKGYKNHPITHMGIVKIENKQIYIIEAYQKVQKTKINDFLKRSINKNQKPKIFVARLKPKYQKYIENALKNAENLINKQYDNLFALNNNKFYCSELIYVSFIDEKNNHIFSLKPMTYKDENGKFIDKWITYFEKLNTKIPEGEMGCNPAQYSKSNKINIIYDYTNNNLTLNLKAKEIPIPPMM